MARNLHGHARSRNLSWLDPFYSYLLIPEERKNIWSELESNSGPLASQSTSLTTRPWLLRRCLVENGISEGAILNVDQVPSTMKRERLSKNKIKMQYFYFFWLETHYYFFNIQVTLIFWL